MIVKVIISFLVAVGIFAMIALNRQDDHPNSGRWR